MNALRNKGNKHNNTFPFLIFLLDFNFFFFLFPRKRMWRNLRLISVVNLVMHIPKIIFQALIKSAQSTVSRDITVRRKELGFLLFPPRLLHGKEIKKKKKKSSQTHVQEKDHFKKNYWKTFRIYCVGLFLLIGVFGCICCIHFFFFPTHISQV